MLRIPGGLTRIGKQVWNLGNQFRKNEDRCGKVTARLIAWLLRLMLEWLVKQRQELK